MSDESLRPKVGVGVLIHDGKGNVVMGQRAGSHGAGTHQLPGGHLEHKESFADCAIREVLEETGLEVGEVRFLTATNDVFPDEGFGGGVKHYITIFVVARVVGGVGEPVAMEPHKCARWDWIPWSQIWEWSKIQGEAEDQGKGSEVEKKMFLPLVNLVKEYPGLERCLEGGAFSWE